MFSMRLLLSDRSRKNKMMERSLRMKKRLVTVCCFVLIFALAVFPCSAAVGGDEIVTPLVNAPCTGGNGTCVMASHGTAHLYDAYTGDDLYSYFCCWQCQNCYTIMATEGDPLLGQIIGHYVFVKSFEPMNATVALLDVDPARIGYINSTRLEGYKFRSASWG